jgi:hypothetical protein
MKKQVWGNATWYLFHTLAYKLKPEFQNEVLVIFNHISNICNNLPCPDCQQHASALIASTNVAKATASKESLNQFVWSFHNDVNKRLGSKIVTFETAQELYSRANTYAVIRHFLAVMQENLNNEKAMLYTFHRKKIMKIFRDYINANIHKYNQ